MVNAMQDILRLRDHPVSIPLKHSIQVPGTKRCLISRDPQQKIKDLLTTKKIKGIHKVIGLGKFPKGQIKQLLDQYDVFLADKRLKRVLAASLGKAFKELKPVYIDLDTPELQAEVIRSIHSSWMNFRKGSTCGVKIALSSHSPEQAYENIKKALPTILAEMPGGVENVRSLFIKTSTSSSLPIYQYLDEHL
ncbi:ribosomal protein L1 [Hesseltinella vesiculosa]|uniref:Ribosomal protein L1 n=1 Tax=Hesseltinella vesiculosa TaxID=101127 RepID=A0A1X2GM21_9FUNG|nr:ribosomal protein L1 [Hesseltinella vesiculosa]